MQRKNFAKNIFMGFLWEMLLKFLDSSLGRQVTEKGRKQEKRQKLKTRKRPVHQGLCV